MLLVTVRHRYGRGRERYLCEQLANLAGLVRRSRLSLSFTFATGTLLSPRRQLYLLRCLLLRSRTW